MHCEVARDGEGKPYAILCGPNRQPRDRAVCSFCGRHFVTYLCDFPVRPNKACDKGMCEKCRVNVGQDKDYCPTHALADPPAEQASLFEEVK